MSGLLLCSSKRGETPYIIADGEPMIWSLEELCCYLYQNAYSITENFFSPKLISYLKEELCLTELAEGLIGCMEKNRNFAELIMLVCQAANYYSKEELEELRERLFSFASLSRPQQLKQLGDSCMERRRYAQALRRYEEFLALRRREACDNTLTGKVYHNMGVAYARLLFYKEAEEYLKEAAGLLPDDDRVKRELLLVYRLSGDTEQYEKQAARLLSGEEKQAAEEEWESIRASACVGEGRPETIIESWKQEYRKQMS